VRRTDAYYTGVQTLHADNNNISSFFLRITYQALISEVTIISLIHFQVWQLYEDDHLLDVVDPRITEFNGDEVLRAIRIGLLCIQSSPRQRPSMSRVVSMLTGDSEVAEAVTKPSYVIEWQMNARGQQSSSAPGVEAMSSSVIDEGR
jgi:hypothetical protein